MDLHEFARFEGNTVHFTEPAASRFAKDVAGDFNPIHDVGSKRFCVPGDLLFAVLLHRYGAAQTSTVEFEGMLGADESMALPVLDAGRCALVNERAKPVLSFEQQGDVCTDESFINQLTEAYVQFSGRAFPDVLVALMRTNGVMINPSRPLVIYKDMAISLSSFEAERVTLATTRETLISDGRKATVCLGFDLISDGEVIGHGEKNMVMGGLREYDELAMQAVVDEYNQRKQQMKAVG